MASQQWFPALTAAVVVALLGVTSAAAATSTDPTTVSQGATELELNVADGSVSSAMPRHRYLTCDPRGGDHPVLGRARLRQKMVQRPSRAIPDRLWGELFDAMGCERARALLEFFVSSGARAAELLGVTSEDLDWAGRRIYVVSKGTREREAIPASPHAFVRLALYFDEIGTPVPGKPIWRTRRGEDRPLTYWALRRILQRVNAVLGTNWTWHDARTPQRPGWSTAER